jgi:hypothetical protein
MSRVHAQNELLSHILVPTAKPALPAESNPSDAQYLKVCQESVKADSADSGRDGSIPAGRDEKRFRAQWLLSWLGDTAAARGILVGVKRE